MASRVSAQLHAGWLGLTCAWLAQAAVPPPVTVVASGEGAILGGVAVGNGGRYYYAGIAPNGKGFVRARNSSNQSLWYWYPPGDEPPIHAVPAISPGGEFLYIGADDGKCYALDALTGAVVWTYTVSTGSDKRIRSSVAVDWSGPLGPTVYFHCFNGRLYALNATTGALRWAALTDNGVPPDNGEHPASEAFTSSPVVGADGTVYVGSTDGYVYAFNAANGTRLWRVNTGRPIEATLAIGRDGWLYAATRNADDSRTPADDVNAHVVAINPAKALANPDFAIEWEANAWFASAGPGYLASPVIDQGGFVYVAEFHNYVLKLHPATGGVLNWWSPGGKICQTPSLTQDGLLIVGTSMGSSGNSSERGIRAIHTGKADSPWSPWWSVESEADFLGAPAIRCTSSGLTYIADTAGRVYRFNSGARAMAGAWPTFQSGVRRLGKQFTYPYLIAELPGFYGYGIYAPTVRNVDPFGRACGQATGYYRYPYGSEWGSSAAVWRHLTIKNPTGPQNALANTFAAAINAFGDVAGWRGTSTPVPVLWPDGANVDAPEVALELGGFARGYAADMNTGRDIIGYVWNSASTNVFRWVWSQGQTWIEQDFGINTTTEAMAYAISDQRRVAGKARFAPGGPWRAYVTDINANQVEGPIGTLGGYESEAWDVNDDSGTVGWAHNSAGRRRAFYLQINAPGLQPANELPRLAGTTSTTYQSEAYGVNRLGQVVGKCQNDAGAWRAFLYTPGSGNQLTDLTTLPLDGGATPASLGWTLTEAVAINDGGIIVGRGYVTYGYSQYYRAWILYPKCVE